MKWLEGRGVSAAAYHGETGVLLIIGYQSGLGLVWVQSMLDAFLQPGSSTLLLWMVRKSPNKIDTTSITLVLHQCKSPFTRVLFACIIGGYHTLH